MNGFETASVMLEALRRRTISAGELLHLHIRRIEQIDPILNAIPVRCFDRAEAAAHLADERRANGEDGPLLGLPHTIKDCIYVKGLVTTGGLAERAGAVSEADAPVAARLSEAGGVLMGKTNVPPYAGDWQADNPVFGRTNNPWDLSRTPGGSTGGGAAAVAAGLSPLEFGGDLGGSIRLPAAFCGIYGHRSSDTAMPRTGHFPGGLLPNQAVAMAAQGPLARSAEDIELALSVVTGPMVGEDTAWKIELPRPRRTRLSEFRVAVLPPIAWARVDDEIASSLDRIAVRLGRAGAVVREAQPDGFGDLREYFAAYLGILSVMTSRGENDRRAEAAQLRSSGHPVDAAWADGITASAVQYINWFGARERYREAYRAFFRDWDLLLAPITMVPAFLHDTRPQEERTVRVNDRDERYDLQLVYPSLCNLSGHPGTAFPAGRTRSGLPIGLQVIGPYLEDFTPIRFAGLLAQEFGGYEPPPTFAAM